MKNYLQEIEDRLKQYKEFREMILKMNFNFPRDAEKCMIQWSANLDALMMCENDIHNLLSLVYRYEAELMEAWNDPEFGRKHLQEHKESIFKEKK